MNLSCINNLIDAFLSSKLALADNKLILLPIPTLLSLNDNNIIKVFNGNKDDDNKNKIVILIGLILVNIYIIKTKITTNNFHCIFDNFINFYMNK
jgi:hypothetical protein